MLRILNYKIEAYLILLLVIFFCSCNLNLTKCEDVKEWKIGEYKIVKSDCLGPAGPHYYPLSLYKDKTFLGGTGYQDDSCTITFQPRSSNYFIFNICNNSFTEIKPDKKVIDIKSIDSVQIFSNTYKQTKLLSAKQISSFIEDWNTSSVSDYRKGNVDSVFFPTFEYKIIVWSGTGKSEFLCFNHLISNRTHWTYYINQKEDTAYFDKLWKNKN
jgi:hypothetical protein